jgi:Icc-related predicted phosphoesterase
MSKPQFVDLEFSNEKTKKIRIICISDTHEKLQELINTTEIPNGDILIHCGDFSRK